MATNFDLTAANAVLKELYFGQTPENLVYRTNPLLAMIPKKTDAGGKYVPAPIIVGASQGRSATFTNAQANQSPVLAKEFLVTRVSDYSIATIDNQTLLATKGDKAAFVDGLKTVVDGAFRSATLSAASALFRDGTGAIGTISSISTGVITLSNAADAVQFEVNQVLQVATSAGGSARTAKGYVIAVDRTAGTVTVATSQGGSAATPTSWVANDVIHGDGDIGAKMKGLAAWLPSTAPSSGESFFGVDRSSDPVRLGGVRYAGTSQPIEEALIDASMLLGREGGMPEYCFMSFASYAALEKALGAKVNYVNVEGPAGISFKGIRVYGANTEIKVMPDRNCPVATAYLLSLDSLKLISLNDVPHLFRYADGLEALRVYNQDAAEARVGYYGNLWCNAPGWNAVVTLAV